MLATKYYPKLSSIVTLNSLPEGLSFIQDDVTSGEELVNLILKPNVQPSGNGVDLPLNQS